MSLMKTISTTKSWEIFPGWRVSEILSITMWKASYASVIKIYRISGCKVAPADTKNPKTKGTSTSGLSALPTANTNLLPYHSPPPNPSRQKIPHGQPALHFPILPPPAAVQQAAVTPAPAELPKQNTPLHTPTPPDKRSIQTHITPAEAIQAYLNSLQHHIK